MRKNSNFCKIVSASLASLLSLSYGVNAMEKDQMRAEVERVLGKFQRNMEEYYQRTKVGKEVTTATKTPEAGNPDNVLQNRSSVNPPGSSISGSLNSSTGDSIHTLMFVEHTLTSVNELSAREKEKIVSLRLLPEKEKLRPRVLYAGEGFLNLKRLDISNTHYYLDHNFFDQAPSLQYLNMSGSSIVSLEKIHEYCSIKDLIADNIEEILLSNLRSIYNLKSLKRLSLKGATFSKMERAEIERGMPHCTIEWDSRPQQPHYNEAELQKIVGKINERYPVYDASSKSLNVVTVPDQYFNDQVLCSLLSPYKNQEIKSFSYREIDPDKEEITSLDPLLTFQATLQTLGVCFVWELKDFSPLAALTNLDSLFLTGNQHFKDLSVIEKLTNLAILDIGLTAVKDLTRLPPHLKDLNIQGCDVGYALTSVSKLTNLTILSIQKVKNVNEGSIQFLKQKLPNCKIYQ